MIYTIVFMRSTQYALIYWVMLWLHTCHEGILGKIDVCFVVCCKLPKYCIYRKCINIGQIVIVILYWSAFTFDLWCNLSVLYLYILCITIMVFWVTINFCFFSGLFFLHTWCCSCQTIFASFKFWNCLVNDMGNKFFFQRQ